MNKKLIVVLIVIILIIGGIAGYAIYQNKQKENKNNTEEKNNAVQENNVERENQNVNNSEKENQNEPNIGETNKKTLVVYYSAQSHTKAVAEEIAKNLDADIFEIVPEEVYTAEDLDYTNSNSRVSKEHDNEELRDVKLVNAKVNNFENYDTVLIGYPIWWGNAAWPVETFVKENDFSGKTVIPFCTSASSGLGESGENLKQNANSGNWLEGHRFSSNASDADIKTWTDSLK